MRKSAIVTRTKAETVGLMEVVVDMDLEKFFDRVNHDIWMGELSKKIGDKRVLKLIRRYLEAGMMAQGVVSPRTRDTTLSLCEK